jgi:signal transduction histidine kinase
MLVKGRVAGLLRLEHSEPGHFAQHRARLALAMANQAGIAIENARLYRAARKVAALEERQRLARELHDSVTQALYAIALGAHTAKEILGEGPVRLKESLDPILALAQTAVSEMRFLIFELRPDYLENETLSTTLSRLADAVNTRYGCEVRLDLTPEMNFSLDLKEALYRISHEALTDIARYARAEVASIEIRQENSHVVLVVQDDGAGFDPGASFPGHLGLQSMRERAAESGGSLEIESGPAKGTTVRARFPLVPALLSPAQ